MRGGKTARENIQCRACMHASEYRYGQRWLRGGLDADTGIGEVRGRAQSLLAGKQNVHS